MTREYFSATTPTHEDETAPNTVLQAIKKGVAVAALMPPAVIGVAGCSSSEGSAPATANSEGWTEVTRNGYDSQSLISKVCDGQNLVYTDGHDIAVSPNDPQCTGKTPEATATDPATAIPTPLPTHE